MVVQRLGDDSELHHFVEEVMKACPPVTRRSISGSVVVATLLAAMLALALPVVGASSASAVGGKGEVYVVQGIVGQLLDVSVDGKKVLSGAKPKTIVGPLSLAPGTHRISLDHGAKSVAATRFTIGAGQSVDAVAHLRSDATMGATITAFRNNLAPVAPGKLRLAVAHTAAAPPADIRVDGQVLFSNVASGDTLTEVVPAATYKVAIVPAATDGQAILGPVRLRLKQATLTRVFAIGNVATGSMDAVVHSLPIKISGASVPRSVQTGDGGQAASTFVNPAPGPPDLLMAAAYALVGVAVMVAIARRRRGRASL
jgi:hypothetical protein